MKDAQLLEVLVLGEDAETLFLGETPDVHVVGLHQVRVLHVIGARKMRIEQCLQPSGQVLVNQQFHAAVGITMVPFSLSAA